ncbi:hypothetical protein RND71_040312 [Anisodus tanguticus]|uniref:NAC domain-containing protein n=1 Tax=Anisodus tanguticus TaxID=243964 RepID=A0AAE1QSM3_9SOLA|nr:hypothetical protein RND71_040312 [Anisodus tanguticus]
MEALIPDTDTTLCLLPENLEGKNKPPSGIEKLPFQLSSTPLARMRFLPLDEELISYLLKFVSSKLFECVHNRDNVDLYGNKKSCDIFDELSLEGEATDVNYFFTQLKRKSVNGKNFIRTMVGGVTWKGLDKA